MIINNFNVHRMTVLKNKAYSPLVIDADTVLASTVALERLQPIARRHPQFFYPDYTVKHSQFAQRNSLNINKPRYASAIKKRFGIGTSENSKWGRVNGVRPQLAPKKLLR